MADVIEARARQRAAGRDCPYPAHPIIIGLPLPTAHDGVVVHINCRRLKMHNLDEAPLLSTNTITSAHIAPQRQPRRGDMNDKDKHYVLPGGIMPSSLTHYIVPENEQSPGRS